MFPTELNIDEPILTVCKPKKKKKTSVFTN